MRRRRGRRHDKYDSRRTTMVEDALPPPTTPHLIADHRPRLIPAQQYRARGQRRERAAGITQIAGRDRPALAHD